MSVAIKNPTNTKLSAALEYAQRGWYVIPIWWPLPHGGCACGNTKCGSIGKHPITLNGLKDGTIDYRQISAWWAKYPDANIAVVTGAVSGLTVLDGDVKDDGLENLAKLERENGKLPDTVEAITGSLGKHAFFNYQSKYKIKSRRFHPGLDVKSDGGYVVVAPSLHVSGRRYEWDAMFNPDETELADCPEWLLKLMSETKTNANGTANVLGEVETIKAGSRNETLFKIAAGWRNRPGMTEPVILAALISLNKEACKPPLDENEVIMIAKSAAAYPTTAKIYPINQSDVGGFSTPKTIENVFPLTDLGNAERLVHYHGADLRFCHPWGKWIVWDEKRWSIDNTGEPNRRAFDTVRQMLSEAAKIEDEKERRARVKWEQKSESSKARREMLDNAKSIKGIPILPDDMDKHLWTLNVTNGEIDLKTGKLGEHKRENLITKLAPVTYDPNAKCPTWETFLNRIMNGNTGLIEFLQCAIGYALTGDTGEQCLFILYGSGANGKSVFLDTVSALFGEDYSQNTPASTLMVKRNEGIPNDIAALKGARFITAIEAEEGQRLAESLVKGMTGGDKMTARFMRGEFFSFIPEFKLFLATNHVPQIRGTDHSIWRRINLIPFEVTIPVEERDRNLSSKLRNELSGILNWAITGCLRWQQKGLGIPKEVAAATDDYRTQMDAIGAFIEECCTIYENAKVSAGDLYKEYTIWTEENGERALNKRQLSQRLGERGFRNERGAGGWYFWKGIGLTHR